MLWQNDSSVIIGRHQNAFEEVDMPYLMENSIALVRRSSGGGAVYHDLGNLNFSFIIPSKEPKIDFQTFLKPIAELLNSLGIPATVSGRNDILAEGKKICGNAQSRGKHAILVHGCMLVDTNLDVLEHVLSGNPDKYQSKGISSIRSRVALMRDYLPEANSREKALELISNALKSYFAPNNTHIEENVAQDVIDEIMLRAQKLSREKYANEKWTLQKSPPFSVGLRKKFAFGSVKVNYTVKQSKITDCKIEGDFFALQDLAHIEKLLVGIDYAPSDIQEAIKSVDFSNFILNAENRDLVALFSEC